MKYNINNLVKVILTARGANVINDIHTKYHIDIDRNWKAGDVYRGELWEVMEIFGEHFRDFDGEGPLFRSNIIDIIDES